MNDEATGRLLMNTNHHNHHHVHIHQQQLQQQQHQINTNGKSSNNDFLKKPGKGWLHSDDAIQNGVMYTVKYIGYIGVKESMKSLSFDVRTQVARESIRRVAENAKLLNLSRRNRTTEEQVNKILSSVCITQWSGMNVQLHINTQVLKVSQLECQDTLFQHTMQNISFACGGDADIQDFVAYVAKDDINGRACYVFECGNNMANNVITTIGQAFELRFKKFLNSMPTGSTSKPANKNVTSPTHANTNEHRPALNINHNNATPLNHNHHHNPHPHHHHQPPPPPPPTSAKMNPPLGQMMKNFTPSTPLQANTPQTQNTPKLPLNTNTKPEPKAQPQTAGAKIDEKLEKMPWFHGLLTRENAEKLLTRDGDYLVRETNKAEKQYVLSGRYKGECRHIFLVDPSGVIRTKDRVFDNICHLIQYHQDNKIPIISKENELLLEYPVFK